MSKSRWLSETNLGKVVVFGLVGCVLAACNTIEPKSEMAALADSESLMSGEQLKALFSDKTCDIELLDASRQDRRFIKAYTAADGSRSLYWPWSNKIVHRKWWVEDDKYCGSHPRSDYCRPMIDAGGGVYYGIKDGERFRKFSNCRRGDQL